MTADARDAPAPAIRQYFGVDFSGARLAGRNTWVARLVPTDGRATTPYRLVELRPLERLCGSAERAPALAHLADGIASSDAALWALDFPFGLPIEVVAPGATWDDQIAWVRAWEGGAYALGVECVARARALGGSMHLRRATDVEEKTPFDCYHYRIIYQTFHGMRDVLARIAAVRGTAILPFHGRRLARARRVLVEACPASTLRRLGLPTRNYKQAAGGPLKPPRRATRNQILSGLLARVEVSPAHRRVMMRNPGGDALDAVIAALGGALAWRSADHAAVARHPRYRYEGRLYVG
jgi:hypothetical protein